MFLVMGITGKVGGATVEHLLAHGKEVRGSAIARRRLAGRTWAWNWLKAIGTIRQPSSGRSEASKVRLSCCRLYGRLRLTTEKPSA